MGEGSSDFEPLILTNIFEDSSRSSTLLNWEQLKKVRESLAKQQNKLNSPNDPT